MLGIIPSKPSFLDLHTYKNCFSWKKLTYLVGPLYWVIHESIQNFQKSIHYQVILRMMNMRLCLLQKICCGMCAIAAFKRSFLKIIISCLPIHFPSSSKKIFRFTFLLGFSFVLVCTLFIRNERNLWPNHGVKPILSEEIFTANAFFISCFFTLVHLFKR